VELIFSWFRDNEDSNKGFGAGINKNLICRSLSENSLEEGLAESRLHQQVMVLLVIGSSLGQLGTGQLGRS
jgi:hypothetical protein